MLNQEPKISQWISLAWWIAMSVAGPCDRGWYYRNGKCYLFHEKIENWNTANSTCTSLNASLVKIKSTGLNTYLSVTAATIFTNNYWIGLRRPDVEYRNFLEGNATILNWRRGEPNDGINACVFSRGSEIIDSPCSPSGTPTAFICQVAKSCDDSTLDTTSFKFHRYRNDTCLMLKQTGSVISWEESNSICSGRSGHLLHMTTHIDNFLKGKVDGYSRISFWIAAKPFKDETFYWIDNTLNHMNESWADGQPDVLTQDCVLVKVQGGLWHDNTCSHVNNFVCEKEAYPFEPPPKKQPKQFDCRCKCARLGKNMIVNMTLEELQFTVAKLKSELAVNKSSLSTVIRRKTSVGDQRMSAAIVGYIGTAIICVVFGLIIIADLPKIFRTLQSFVRKVQFVQTASK